MKKLLMCAAVSLQLLLPATGVLASEASAPPAGTDPCPAGHTGTVVWHWDTTANRYRYHHICFSA